MRVGEQDVCAPGPAGDETVLDPNPGGELGWADQTRRVLTRDLLLRAAMAQPGESRALQFRALYLNLPLIGEAAERLALSEPERGSLEHAALDGLAQAIREFDPTGPAEFADVAVALIERQMLDQRHAPGPSRRQLQQAVRRILLLGSRSRH